jgi:hypothetical protein
MSDEPAKIVLGDTVISAIPTIALLILKPWRLTNEFLAGKRVRYVNPLRLYLLASILFFFAVPITGWIIALLWIAFVMQIFLSIRFIYRQGWFISIFKFFFGGIVYLTVLAVALAATFFATLVSP